MKKTTIALATALLLAVAAEGAASPRTVCTVPDFLCAPVPHSSWDVDTARSGERIVSMKATRGEKGEYFRQRVFISRVPRSRFPKRRWERGFDKYVRAKYASAAPMSGMPGASRAVRYTFSDHFLPVEGMAVARDVGSFVYVVDCQRQSINDRSREPLVTWCGDYFQDITWAYERPIKQDGGDYFKRWSKMEFDAVGLQKEYDAILKRAQHGRIKSSLIEDYIGLVITESLYSPAPRSRSSLLDDIAVLRQRVRGSGDRILALVLDIHANYLQGNDTLAEKEMKQLVQMQPRAPYWLMSRWIQKRDRGAALSFAERAVIAYPSAISEFTRASLLKQAGHMDDVEQPLARAASKNANAMSLLALNALEQDRVADAQKYIRRGESRDSDDVNMLIAKARLHSKATDDREANFKKANEIYEELLARSDLSTETRIKLYFEWADIAYDPDKKIEYYDRVIALKKNTPRAYYLKGKVYLLEKRDVTAALGSFRQYLRYAPPGDPKTQQLRKLIWKLESQSYG